MKSRHKARELAIQTLYSMDFNGTLSKEGIPAVFSGLNDCEYDELESDVKLFAHYLINGTVEHLEEIDELISQYSTNRPIERINSVDRSILRMSIFSLLYMKDVHPHIVIDEAVKLSQSFSTDVNYKFINGILDAMQRDFSSGRI